MSNDSRSEDLAVQLTELRKELYKLVDDALVKITHSCAGLTQDVVKNVVAAVFQPLSYLDSEVVAAAAPAKATEAPAPKEIVEEQAPASELQATAPASAEKSVPVASDNAPKRRGRKAVWANSSDASLRQAHAKRVRENKPIEPDLDAALAQRFANYDPVTHRFTGGIRKERTEKVTAEKTVMAPVAKPVVENNIAAETLLSSPKNKYGNYPLMFDGETTLLRGTEYPFELVLFDKKTKIAVVRKKSKDTYHKLFIIRCKKGKVLQEMRMGARDIKYIPSEHTLMAREIPEGVKRYLSFAADGKISSTNFAPLNTLCITARQFIKETLIIDENGNVEKYPLMTLENVQPAPVQKIVKSVESGNSAAPKKVNRKYVQAQASKMNADSAPKASQPAPAPIQKVTPAPVVAAPVEPAPIAPAAPVVQPAPVAPVQETAEKPAQTPVQKPVQNMVQAPAPKQPKPAPVSEDLVVTARLTKMTLDGKYYDVFVNGKRILHNHVDTQLKVFLNGTVLGVHGRVTDIENFPDTPSWQIYDTNLKRRTFSQINPFTKKSVFIKDVRTQGSETLALEISNKLTIMVDEIYSLQRFKIASENTK